LAIEEEYVGSGNGRALCSRSCIVVLLQTSVLFILF
jgi:hypothetical protein